MKKNILYVLALCFLLRLTFFIAVHPWTDSYEDRFIVNDALEYHKLAISLVNYYEFSYEKGGPPNDVRTPGYPIFIGIFYFLFGNKPWIVLLFQLVLDTITCFLIYLTARRFLGEGLGFLASIFYALDPSLILHSVDLLSEILFVFTLVLFFYFFSHIILEKGKDLGTLNIIISGALLSVTIYVKPASEYLAIILFFFLIVYLRKRFKLAVKYASIFLLIVLLTLSPLLIRSYLLFDSFSLTVSGSANLLAYAAPIEMEKKGISYDSAYKSFLSEADSMMVKNGLTPSNLSYTQKSEYWQKTAINHIFSNPYLFIKHWALGVFHQFFNVGSRNFAEKLNLRVNPEEFNIMKYPSIFQTIIQWFLNKSLVEIIIGIIIIIFLIVTYLCALIGFLKGWKLFSKEYLILCLIMALYFSLISGPQGIERYRIPAIPFYLNFSAIGLSIILDRFRNKKKTT